MPITSVTSDPERLQLIAVGEYPVSVERLWAAWADPRQLERFWGPPSYPATFTRHEVRAGGRSEYTMTGPKGERSRGYWVFDRVEAPALLELRDGFCHDDGSPNLEMPTIRMKFSFEPTEKGSRFTSVSTFPDLQAMERLVAMGMIEGMSEAMGQLDAVLADLREYSAGFKTNLEILDDTHALVRREVRGSIDQIWRAHHEPELLRKWMLGPDGWTLPVCTVATDVGQSYRYEWQQVSDGQRFGFTGELLEADAPRRAVTTERMIGVEGPGTVNELVLTPRPGGRTEIALRITYPSREMRDQVLATGMVDGMEASYARMEGLLA